MLYGSNYSSYYRTSVKPIDFATTLIKLTDDDFDDKEDFIKTQCDKYYACLDNPNNSVNITAEKLDVFKSENGTILKCEDVLDRELRWVLTK